MTCTHQTNAPPHPDSCFLLFTVFVPISLLVTLDMVKFLQGTYGDELWWP